MAVNNLEADLAHFTGTEQWYCNPLYPRMAYTDGVKYFAENAGGGAYWFLGIVGTEIHHLHRKQEEFMHIVLDSDGNKANIIVDDGNGRVLFSRRIDFTDCPAGKWQFYLTNDVLLLPSEY